MRQRENKYFHSVTSLPDAKKKIKKKTAKNWKNWKIPLWLYFNPKSVGKSWDREKIKIIVPFRPHPTQNWKFQKNSKKMKNIKKYCYGLFSIQNTLEKAKKEKKWKLLFRYVPTRPIIENSKNIATKFVKVINTLMASFQAKIGWKRLRKRENKNYRFVSSLPDV